MSYYVTFYSYKGGVGRTLALANVAYSLAERGKRVVLLDLDLEAPGLQQFQEFKLAKSKRGFLDYAEAYSRSAECAPIKGFVHKCELSFAGGELWLMPSGKRGPGYQERLARLTWNRLHPRTGTMPFIEGLQEGLEEYVQPHYVLIDARTGLSDVGGLSTNCMADMVVLVFNLTTGCIEGSAEVCKSFLHEDSRPRVVQLVACPVPPSAGGKRDRVEEQLALAAKKIPDAMRFRKIVRIDYDPAMVLASELAVRRPERYRAAQRYGELRKIIQRSNAGEVFLVLEEARELRGKGRLEEAIELLRGFAERHEDNAEGWLELGGLLLESGRSEDAIRAFRKSCRVAPRFVMPYRRLGEALLAAGEPREALESLERVKELEGRSWEILGLLAAVYAEIGDTARYVAARQSYAGSLFEGVTTSGVVAELEPQELRREFVEALSLNPPYAGFDAEDFWQLLMGSVASSQGEKFRIARSLLRGDLGAKKVIRLRRSLEEEREQLCEVLGEGASALFEEIAAGHIDLRDSQAVRKALSGQPSDIIALRCAAALTDDLNEKVDLLQEALSRAPNDRRVINDILKAAAERMASGGNSLLADRVLVWVKSYQWDTKEKSELEFESGLAIGKCIDLISSRNIRMTLAKVSRDRFLRVLEDSPESQGALNNLGLILADLAESSLGRERLQLYSGALDSYQRAVLIDPGFAAALSNWGLTLARMARLVEGPERKGLMKESVEKCAQAVELQPDLHEALNNWGAALGSLAKLEEKSGQEEYYREASEKFKRAVELRPDSASLLAGWGVALAELAGVKMGAERRRLYKASLEKFSVAVSLRPNSHSILSNWAVSLLKQWRSQDAQEGLRSLRKARSLCVRANEIEPQSADYNLACAETLLGETKSAASVLVRHLLRRPRDIGQALGDPDLNSIWEAYPDLRRAVEACQKKGATDPLAQWRRLAEMASQTGEATAD